MKRRTKPPLRQVKITAFQALISVRSLKSLAVNIDRISRRLDLVSTAGIDLELASRPLLTIGKTRCPLNK